MDQFKFIAPRWPPASISRQHLRGTNISSRIFLAGQKPWRSYEKKKILDCCFRYVLLAGLSKAPHPNAGKLFIDFLLSKEGQKMLVGFRRIPVREDVDADPPRLFKGYKRVVEHPEDYRNFNETVRLYQEILGIR